MNQRLDFAESLKAAKVELGELQAELGECLAQQEELEKKIAAVRQMIFGFSNALGETFEEADEIGLTEAVRQAFKTQTEPLEPIAVRTRLQQLGFNTKRFGNLMASIHTVINRLVGQGQIRPQNLQPGNKPAYVWIPRLGPGLGADIKAFIKAENNAPPTITPVRGSGPIPPPQMTPPPPTISGRPKIPR
jgi:hypothetical protein